MLAPSFFSVPAQVGVCHADDLLYLWDPVDINPEDGPLPQQVECLFLPPAFFQKRISFQDSQLRDIMVTAWANFAK